MVRCRRDDRGRIRLPAMGAARVDHRSDALDMIPFEAAEIALLLDLLDVEQAEAASRTTLRAKLERWFVLQQQRDVVNRRPV